MRIFDGQAYAARVEERLVQRVQLLDDTPHIAAILFVEDSGSQLYTGIKKAAAERVGIQYEVHDFSLQHPVEKVQAAIRALNERPDITGIIIQKPWRKTWVEAQERSPQSRAAQRTAYNQWWESLTTALALEKDVDGLHPTTLQAIADGTWQEQGFVMPATAQAIWEILHADTMIKQRLYEVQTKVVILGRSDLVGTPLAHRLEQHGISTELLGRAELRQRKKSGQLLHDADIIVSATGVHHLVTGEMIGEGVALIDVGEPRADVDQASVSSKASFLTPVPGGVGPVTVVCLLQNAVQLVSS